MPSVVDICNMALSRIGNGQRIDSLTERSKQAEECSLFYAQTRDWVLRDRPWPFATKFVSLAQSGINPDPIYPYSYAFPTDCLFARKIVNQIFPVDYWPFAGNDVCIPQVQAVPFRVIQGESTRLIATSVTPATLEYTVRIEDPGLFDPIFVSALAYKLAVEIAPALAKEPSIADRMEAAYQGVVASAFAQGMNEGQGDRMPESIFITGRESR